MAYLCIFRAVYPLSRQTCFCRRYDRGRRCFVAGLLAGLADSGIPTNTRQLERIIAQAQICGALATTAKGAMTALPRQHDLLHNSDPDVVSVTRFVVPVTFTKSV